MDRRIAALGFALVLSACGGTGGPDHQDAADFSITVQSAWTADSIGALMPAAGDTFLELSVELANQTHATPLAAAFAFFTVKTSDSLVLQPNATASAVIEPSCSADVSVAAGGSFTCSVVFELSSDQTPAELDYTEPETVGSASASAPINDVKPVFTLENGNYVGDSGENVVNTCSPTFSPWNSHDISHDVHGNIIFDEQEVFVMNGNTGTWTTSKPENADFCGAMETMMDVITLVSNDHFDLTRAVNLTGLQNDGSSQCNFNGDTCTYSYLQHWSYQP